MGAMKQATIKPSNNAPKSASNPYGGDPTHANGQALDWLDVNPLLITEAISTTNKAGDALTFARGAHGRWLSVTVLCGDGNTTLRAFSMEEAEEHMQNIIRVASERAR